MPRGRPRKLRPEEGVSIQNPTESNGVEQSISKNGKTDSFRFDLNDLDSVIPYKPEEGVPLPITRIDKKGNKVLVKKGEPRYYFNPGGTELIQVHKGITKKTRIAWQIKLNHKDYRIAKRNRSIKQKLVEKGVLMKGRDF